MLIASEAGPQPLKGKLTQPLSPSPAGCSYRRRRAAPTLQSPPPGASARPQRPVKVRSALRRSAARLSGEGMESTPFKLFVGQVRPGR